MLDSHLYKPFRWRKATVLDSTFVEKKKKKEIQIGSLESRVQN